MTIQETIGIILSTVMILSQLSLLWGDNLFFRWGTRVVIGFSVIHTAIWQLYWIDYRAIQPILNNGDYKFFIPLILGIMMYARLSKANSWISKYPMGVQLGVGVGVVSVAMIRSQILDQLRDTVLSLFNATTTMALLNAVLVLIGTVTVMSYFFFTKEHTGILGISTYIGRGFIMSSIATIWAGDYIWAMSMLAGQLQFLIREFLMGLLLNMG